MRSTIVSPCAHNPAKIKLADARKSVAMTGAPVRADTPPPKIIPCPTNLSAVPDGFLNVLPLCLMYEEILTIVFKSSTKVFDQPLPENNSFLAASDNLLQFVKKDSDENLPLASTKSPVIV